jgi:hypothetical protein
MKLVISPILVASVVTLIAWTCGTLSLKYGLQDRWVRNLGYIPPLFFIAWCFIYFGYQLSTRYYSKMIWLPAAGWAVLAGGFFWYFSFLPIYLFSFMGFYVTGAEFFAIGNNELTYSTWLFFFAVPGYLIVLFARSKS